MAIGYSGKLLEILFTGEWAWDHVPKTGEPNNDILHIVTLGSKK